MIKPQCLLGLCLVSVTSEVLVQWYSFLFSLPPFLFLTSAFLAHFLEAQDPVDCDFFFLR